MRFEQAPASVLVVVTRRIGDVLLATPLVRSLRRAWPQARIDALVFSGTQGILRHNPDLTSVLDIAPRPRTAEHLAFVRGLWRRYDLALSLAPGDRPTLYAWAAGRRRCGLLEDASGQRWKQHLLHEWAAFDNEGTHTVRMHLALAGLLGIEPMPEVVVAWNAEDEDRVRALAGAAGEDLVVLHPRPNFNYKMWPQAHWVALGSELVARGLQPLLTGGPAPEERAYVAEIAQALGAPTVAGELSLTQTACLIARARLFVGPDTAVTHMAAALGVPTVALFGPSDPVKWGPWPRDFRGPGNPWVRRGSQTSGNVTLLQGPGACVPCRLEGCERHTASFSDCLRDLPVETVVAASARALAGSPPQCRR